MSANAGNWFVKHDGEGHIIVNNESGGIPYFIDASKAIFHEFSEEFLRRRSVFSGSSQ